VLGDIYPTRMPTAIEANTQKVRFLNSFFNEPFYSFA